MDIFEEGIVRKVRFETTKGLANMEDLNDMPLTNMNGFSLDAVARSLHKEIKENEGVSFVEEKSATDTLLELKLDIVKQIIKRKLEEKAQRENMAINKIKKQKILDVLADKEDDSLKGKSPEELKKMLDEL